MRMLLSRLFAETRGVTVIEFAVVAPVMLLTIMGLGDLGYRVYAQATLDGAVQKASRDATLESGPSSIATIDGRVRADVQRLARSAQVNFSRRAYSSFTNVGPEEFTDGNANGRWDTNECFVDVNGNGAYDLDPGRSGQGRAHDVVLYTVTVDYPLLFPVGVLIGLDPIERIVSTSVLRNQPFNTKSATTAERICPTP